MEVNFHAELLYGHSNMLEDLAGDVGGEAPFGKEVGVLSDPVGQFGTSRRARARSRRPSTTKSFCSTSGVSRTTLTMQGFTKRRRPICGIFGILVDKRRARNRISANCRVIARGFTFAKGVASNA